MARHRLGRQTSHTLLLALSLGSLATLVSCDQEGGPSLDLDNSIQAKQSDVANGGWQTLELTTVDLALNSSERGTQEEEAKSGSLLERRLDRLEFGLRKSMHHMMKNNLPTNQLNESDTKWTSLVARLELIEKLITVTATKLYDTELKVKQLQKCDCPIGCKWSPGDSSNSTTFVTKLDGQVWEHKCDLCSCHRGHVMCRHVTCAQLDCPDPQHVAGKCCPVCFKSCFYKTQTVRHANKLVISSNHDTCKECVCIDGRFKCQRVELGSRPSAFEASNRPKRSSLQESMMLSPLDLEHDYQLDESADEMELELEERRMRRNIQFNMQPLVCPQITCKPEDQIKLDNDCCTYCHDFDFCAHKSYRHQCHPSAYCVNTNLSLVSNNQQNRPRLESMFSCHCGDGFSGNGRFCSDIDECSDRSLNDCDPKSSYCVNLPGSFECRCKRGFRPTPVVTSEEPVDLKIASVRKFRGCQDIDECADGKLNRCHSNARCINVRGSYKCHCKRGYLGNGFECHRWFSLDSNVATYLYRHSINISKINKPLGSLNDPDDDQASSEPADNSDAEDDDIDDLDDDYEDGNGSIYSDQQLDDNKTRNLGPELSEAKWEHLRSESAFQQFDNQKLSNSRPDSDFHGHQSLTSNDPSSAALNTRTMLFQPPRPRHNENVTSTVRAQHSDANEKISTTTTNSSVYTHRPSDPVQWQQQREVMSTTRQISPLANHSQVVTENKGVASPAISQLGSLTSPNINNPGAPKRGTIIASATSSPIKGYSSRTVTGIRVQHNQKSKALGVRSDSHSNNQHLARISSTSANITILVPVILSLIHLYHQYFNHVVTFYFL